MGGARSIVRNSGPAGGLLDYLFFFWGACAIVVSARQVVMSHNPRYVKLSQWDEINDLLEVCNDKEMSVENDWQRRSFFDERRGVGMTESGADQHCGLLH